MCVCVLMHSVRLAGGNMDVCMFVCACKRWMAVIIIISIIIIRTHCSWGPSSTCWVPRCLFLSCSITLSLSLCPLLSYSPSQFLPCCVHIMNSEKMKDALSTLFWKVLSQVWCKLNISFSASVPLVCSSTFLFLLFSLSLSLSLCFPPSVSQVMY